LRYATSPFALGNSDPPHHWYEQNFELRKAIDQISGGQFSRGERSLFQPLVENLLDRDDYLLLESYVDCQVRFAAAYRDQNRWMEMAILNVAQMGKFSSDRSIRDYCAKIWNTERGKP
jgi:starch phosphorylase